MGLTASGQDPSLPNSIPVILLMALFPLQGKVKAGNTSRNNGRAKLLQTDFLKVFYGTGVNGGGKTGQHTLTGECTKGGMQLFELF